MQRVRVLQLRGLTFEYLIWQKVENGKSSRQVLKLEIIDFLKVKKSGNVLATGFSFTISKQNIEEEKDISYHAILKGSPTTLKTFVARRQETCKSC